MKKILSLILVVCIISSLIIALPVSVSAAETFEAGRYTYTVSNGEATLTFSDYPYIDDSPVAKDLTIPSTLGGYPVVSIGKYAFGHMDALSGLTNIIVPEGVRTIEARAFNECMKLVNITLPDSLTSIGEGAFSGCSNLKSITIPGGVSKIEDNTFWSCDSLESVTLNEGVTSIGYMAFEGCDKIKTITLPESLTSIGEFAFGGCDNLTDVYYGGNKATWYKISISDYNDEFLNATIHFAKDDEEGVEYTVASGVYGKDITWTLDNKGKLTITGTGDMYDGYEYLSHREDVLKVTISEGITSIGGGAFANCSNLKNIIIPEGVEVIIHDAFYGCSNLESIFIPESVAVIDLFAFDNCTSLTDVYYAGSEDEWNSISYVYDIESMLNATIHYNSGKVTFTSEASFGKTSVSDKTLRFYFTPTYGEEVEVTNFGAYVVPFALFSEDDVTADGEAINYSAGKSIESGKTYSVDLIDIPEAAYDEAIVALPYVFANGKYVYGDTASYKVNDLK